MENTPWETLFTSDIGLLSLFTIGFICVMAVYIFMFVRKNVLNAEAEQTHPTTKEASGHH
ncbi:hypothetical protein JCM19000A_11260 [Silvimonas sp. JCM 19000]